MKSLFAKIFVWFWCALAITAIGSAFISALGVNENDSDTNAPVARLVTFQLAEARASYETGGRPGLDVFLETLHKVYNARGVLTDENGRDLLTNQDRSDLVKRATIRPRFTFFSIGGSMVARAADDGKYWFFFIREHDTVASWFLQPAHVFVIGVAVLLCYWLAMHLTSPVRSLQKAVERFGRGDFTARVGSTRRDELGQLARTFDRMAERIETLMAAERRLLLDISHELRSPLARLGVAIELARSGDDADAALNRIQKESDRLNTLVGELLQVTRAEVDPSLMPREMVRLDQLVRELVEESAIEASARGCQLRILRDEPVTVEGDPELLRRAVENVLRNAIRHTLAATEVHVTLERAEDKALLLIRDHGPGAPEEALPRLFDAFYRVERDRDRTSGGIGLGLSIARRAVELHKGRISARNTLPGLGVQIELPAAAE